jgi:hypothetical protein
MAPRPLISLDESALLAPILNNQLLQPYLEPLPSFDRQPSKIDDQYAVEPFNVETLYAFSAEEDDELTFIPGDIIIVSHVGGREDIDGWWYGTLENNNKHGWFPSEFSQIC